MKILLFAGAVSMDGLAAGMACGIRSIRIPWLSQVIIAAASGLTLMLAMVVGSQVGGWLKAETAVRLGAVLLAGMSAFFFLQGCRDYLSSRNRNSREPLLSVNIRPLGVVIQILQAPESADRDASGEISWREAAWLGLALSLDSFGAGIGVALAGFPIVWTALWVFLLHFAAMNRGLVLGRRIGGKIRCSMPSFLTGGVFLFLSVIQIL